jgi:hypothetical protein
VGRGAFPREGTGATGKTGAGRASGFVTYYVTNAASAARRKASAARRKAGRSGAEEGGGDACGGWPFWHKQRAGRADWPRDAAAEAGIGEHEKGADERRPYGCCRAESERLERSSARR